MPEDTGEHKRAFAKIRMMTIVFELAIISVIAVVFIVLVHEFVVQPFVTAGDSMMPTFSSGDYLVIDRLSYRFKQPSRGDVIVFRYPLDPSVYFIKRVIGLPGDVVSDTNGAVYVEPQGSPTSTLLVEPYLSGNNDKKGTTTITLSQDEYFVMGDNRDESFDSRTWGPVPERYLLGEPILRLFPLQKFAILPGQFTLNASAAATTSSSLKSVLSTPAKR